MSHAKKFEIGAVLALLAVVITGNVWVYFASTPAAVITSQQFTASYYKGATLSGLPALVRGESSIELKSVPSAVNKEEFSVRWEGTISADQTATYAFRVAADDGVRMWIDGKQVLNKWYRQNSTHSVDVPLTKGAHKIKVEYFQQWSGYKLKVDWSGPAGQNPSGNVGVPSAPVGNVGVPTSPTTTPPTQKPPVTSLSGPTAVIFFTGGGASQGDKDAITARYLSELPIDPRQSWLRLDYDDQAAVDKIHARFPNRKVILVGHSFGGDRAVKTAEKIGQDVELLVLLDPVHSDNNMLTDDFKIPSHVKKAVVYQREFHSTMPVSVSIANPRPQDRRIIYPKMDKNNTSYEYIRARHGDAVWYHEVFNLIESAL